MVVLVLAGVILAGLFAGRSPEPPPAEAGFAPPTDYDPVAAGEPPPRGFRQVLPRDAIRPVYVPEFVPASEAAWDDAALVIGVEVEGEAKAYPVQHLNRREMVIDRLGGIPILVTW